MMLFLAGGVQQCRSTTVPKMKKCVQQCRKLTIFGTVEQLFYLRLISYFERPSKGSITQPKYSSVENDLMFNSAKNHQFLALLNPFSFLALLYCPFLAG